MKSIARTMGTLLTGAVLACGQSGAQPEVALRAAMELETVKGDLRGAIQRYARLAEGKDRAVAAQALVRMAQCHEKLGDAEARKIYERIVREYPEQKEAALLARTWLGGGAHAKESRLVARQVWTGPKVDTFGTVSSDGRSISYADWSTGNLAVHDLATGEDRSLTGKRGWADSPAWVESSAISRDNNLVAYAWHPGGPNARFELRVANLSGDPSPRVLFTSEDVPWIAPYDWTPDRQWIAVQVQRRDRTKQIAMVSARDGSLRVLKSVDWRGSSRMFFSPDGRYLAYDLPPNADSEQRDVFVLAADGAQEVAAVTHPSDDLIMGWSPGGRHLLFASDRAGTMGLWALPLSGAKPRGSAELIKPDISQEGIGISRSGALYYSMSAGARDILTATVDLRTGEVKSAPVQPVSTHLGRNAWPSWSPDGKLFAYFTNGDPRGRTTVLNIRPADTGKTHSFPLDLEYPYFPRWLPSGHAIAARAADRKGRVGIYRIDVTTGHSSLVPNGAGNMIPAGWSVDERKLYGVRGDQAAGGWIAIEKDVESGAERELVRDKEFFSASVSPDGRHLAFVTRERATQTSFIRILPLDGGEVKELTRFGPGAVNVLAWTPDSRSVIFHKVVVSSPGEPDLWVAPITGEDPRKIQLKGPNLDQLWQFSIHPDGKQIVFVAGQKRNEIWEVENIPSRLGIKP